MDLPNAAFFRGSPLFEVIDFLDRLAPFSEPTLVVRAETPRFEPRAWAGHSQRHLNETSSDETPYDER